MANTHVIIPIEEFCEFKILGDITGIIRTIRELDLSENNIRTKLIGYNRMAENIPLTKCGNGYNEGYKQAIKDILAS